MTMAEVLSYLWFYRLITLDPNLYQGDFPPCLGSNAQIFHPEQRALASAPENEGSSGRPLIHSPGLISPLTCLQGSTGLCSTAKEVPVLAMDSSHACIAGSFPTQPDPCFSYCPKSLKFSGTQRANCVIFLEWLQMFSARSFNKENF